ncbi:MAG: tetratricopeptide repeat protein [Theionarchaea archaeon]|nr:tetratricopeptide repeat protein [Theionarchaea archaeon]
MIIHPRILYLLSAPLVALDGCPLDALDMESERDVIVRELAACKKEILVRIGHATTEELARSIAEEFNILYVSSHGREEFLLFEDGKGGSHAVTGDYLKRLIQMGGPFELAVVTACYSEKIGEMLVEAGIRHVVAITCDTPVLDHAAIVFVGQFFRSLFQGDSVRKAFEMASLLVEGNPELKKIKPQLEFLASRRGMPFVPEEDKFVLLPSDSAVHENVLLSAEVPEGDLLVEEPTGRTFFLPVRPHSFTGRSLEMYDIINELGMGRLVTITGVGGIGKTMVAIEVARWFCTRAQFPDGVFYVDLRQTDTVEGVIDVLGSALGVQSAELEDVVVHLGGRHVLLVLDNAEDILWQDERSMQQVVDYILRFTSHTTLLVTSQRPVGGNLHESEHIYRLCSLEQDDAALLFLLTARRRLFREEWESGTFLTLMEQLGGHPLSIVLSACQLVPGAALEDLMKRIGRYRARAFKVRDITERDRDHGESLVASLSSAYDSLSDDAKTLFGVLSLLPAGAQEEMLTSIWGDMAWEYIRELNEASLVEMRNRRATLLPPVRLFATTVTGDEIRTQYGPRILEFLGTYVKTLYKHHTAGDAREYRSCFSVDEPNLRSAIHLPCEPPQTEKERSAIGLLSPRLMYLYFYHDRLKEAREVGERMLSILEGLHDHVGRADTLLVLGLVSVERGDLEEARLQYETALSIYEEVRDTKWEANTLWKLGGLFMLSGDFGKAQSTYERALRMYHQIDENLGEANILQDLGDLLMLSGDFGKAQSTYERALRMYQQIDENLGEANIHKHLGDLLMLSGDSGKAQSAYERALRMYRHIDEKDGEASTFLRLGQWAALTGRLEYAEANLERGLLLCREIGHLEGEADAHILTAFLHLMRSESTKARYELDCCASILEKLHAHYRAVQWLILYAVQLRTQNLEEGAMMCLEYAGEFAARARNQSLQSQVEQHLGKT